MDVKHLTGQSGIGANLDFKKNIYNPNNWYIHFWPQLFFESPNAILRCLEKLSVVQTLMSLRNIRAVDVICWVGQKAEVTQFAAGYFPFLPQYWRHPAHSALWFLWVRGVGLCCCSVFTDCSYFSTGVSFLTSLLVQLHVTECCGCREHPASGWLVQQRPREPGGADHC